jgi:hypothetical protein
VAERKIFGRYRFFCGAKVAIIKTIPEMLVQKYKRQIFIKEIFMAKKVGVITFRGDAPSMNAALRAIAR